MSFMKLQNQFYKSSTMIQTALKINIIFAHKVTNTTLFWMKLNLLSSILTIDVLNFATLSKLQSVVYF